jgi:hypothetical protein
VVDFVVVAASAAAAAAGISTQFLLRTVFQFSPLNLLNSSYPSL